MSISSDLRKAAMGPTPRNPEGLTRWLRPNADEAFQFARKMSHDFRLFYLSNMTDNERRMYLLFLAHAAEDEGK